MTILKDFSYNEDGIDFKKAITINAAYCYAMNRGSKYCLLKYLIRFFFPLQEVCFFDAFTKKKILFTSGVYRKDYDELIQTIRASVPNSSYFHLGSLFKRKFRLPKGFYFNVLKAGFKCRCNIKQKFYLAFKLLDYVEAYKSLKHSGSYVALNADYCYVPLNSANGIENIITQYLNSRGCRTFHLCHGLHFSPNYKFWSIDAFNKELISAQIVLSWGKSFENNDKRLYHHHYHHEIVGNPKYPVKKICINFATDSCIVFLARVQYSNNNYKLLSVLREYSKNHDTKFYIKPHPTDDMNTLRRISISSGFVLFDDGRTVSEILNSSTFGFAIAYETTAYFEAMYNNLVCFRYAFEENESYGDFDDRFIESSDLKDQVRKYSTMNLMELSSKIQTYLEYEIGMGINRYAEVLR